jgi:hypothetical protein
VIVAERQPRRRRPERRRLVWRVGLVALALVLAFLVGIAFARSLDQRPKRGGVVTSVRTLTPVTQQPSIRTVTVTVTAP